MFYKKNFNLCFRFKIVNNLLTELKKLIIVCQKNFYYFQNFQNQTYHKGVKASS